MVIGYEFLMGQHRDEDHQEDTIRIILNKDNRSRFVFLSEQESLFTKIYKMAVFYVHQKMTSKIELKIESTR